MSWCVKQKPGVGEEQNIIALDLRNILLHHLVTNKPPTLIPVLILTGQTTLFNQNQN